MADFPVMQGNEMSICLRLDMFAVGKHAVSPSGILIHAVYKKIYTPILKKYAPTLESLKKICYYIKR